SNETAFLELVEERDDAAGVEPERIGDGGLRLAGSFGQDGEQAVVVGVEAFLLDAFERLGLEGEPEPGKEKAAAGDELLRYPRDRPGSNFGACGCHHGNKCSAKAFSRVI